MYPATGGSPATAGATNYTYTDAGRLATREWAREVTTGTPVTTTYGYDTAGRLTGVSYNDSTTPAAAYTYDTAGRLATVSAPAGGSPATAGFTYDYLADTYGLVQSVTGPAHTVTNQWENNRNVLAVKTNADLSSTPVTVSAYNYSVNNIGQRTASSTAGTAFGTDQRDRVWNYDALGQVTAEADTNNAAFDRGFAYDAIGNRTSSIEGNTDPTASGATSYTANALNQYTAVQLASSQLVPGYDSDGNLLDDAGINTGTSGDRNFIWDAENRLIEVKDESDGTTIATYAYDYLGRRVRKTVPGTGGEDTVFLYDGWNVIAEYQLKTENWELKTSYTWGMDLSGSMQGAGGVGGLLAVNDGTNTFYPTYDGNGNVSEYLNASGANIAHYEYDAFGNIVKATGSSEDFRYRFSTKPLDEEIGWYYYGYRYYDPLTGRWPSRDPIEENGGMNIYGFVGNRAILFIDLLGLQEFVEAEPYPVDPGDVAIGADTGATASDITDVGKNIGKGLGWVPILSDLFPERPNFPVPPEIDPTKGAVIVAHTPPHEQGQKKFGFREIKFTNIGKYRSTDPCVCNYRTDAYDYYYYSIVSVVQWRQNWWGKGLRSGIDKGEVTGGVIGGVGDAVGGVSASGLVAIPWDIFVAFKEQDWDVKKTEITEVGRNYVRERAGKTNNGSYISIPTNYPGYECPDLPSIIINPGGNIGIK